MLVGCLPLRVQKCERAVIAHSTEERVECSTEWRVTRSRFEQSEAGPELHRIDLAEDPFGCAFAAPSQKCFET
jgi:hypothetical protein